MIEAPFQFSTAGGAGFNAPLTPGKQASAVPFGGNTWTGIGYDATHHVGKRKQPHSRTLSEDLELRDMSRRLLTTSTRDLVRNFSIASWMVSQYVLSVSSFHFRPQSGDDGLDRDLQQFMGDWSKPENCDSTARHSLPDLIRLWSTHAVIDGDILINRIKTGKLQSIEGDRIQTFGGIPFADLGIDDPTYVINGVWTNVYGRALGYMVFRRPPQWGALQFDRMIPARFADMLGYYMRVDQIRGVSPLASCANLLRDLYETIDYGVMKAKISQYLVLQVLRASGDEFGVHEDREGEDQPQADGAKPRYDINLGRGPVIQELDPGDKMEFVESGQPSIQVQQFLQVCTMIALKALGLPFSFFDESHTNYSGARLAGIRYEALAETRRHRTRMLLDKITSWRLGLAIADGEIKLPAGKEPRDVRFEWTHASCPLFDPMKEVTADIAAVNAGFASPQEVCRMRGKDFKQIVNEIAEAQAYAKSKGVTLATALPAAANDDPNKQQTQTEDQNEVEEDKAAKARSTALWNG